MQIRRVTAHAFGPFKDRTIELAEGMTVIVGPNEAGKSSWHAAIYASLCGMRRGRGRRLKTDEEFAQRHEPWEGDLWEVSCVLSLPDGRTVELRHDLTARVDCTARDLDLGTDVSHEIIFDGSPDGSRWLGLERRAFLAVASIRQAQILSVTEHAGALQEHLQRAAATAGTDETAAAALVALDAYMREEVGSRRSNSRKPLMEAMRAHELAAENHKRAVDEHRAWLERHEELGEVDANATQARKLARAAEAIYAQQIASDLDKRFTAAKEIAVRYPSPPSDTQQDMRLAQLVATALHGWEQRPHPQPPLGPSVSDLEAQLKSLPFPPTGDTEVAPKVQAAHRVLTQAVDRYEAHLQQEPAGDAAVDVPASDSELYEIARELDTPVQEVDPELEEEVARLTEFAANAPDTGRRVAIWSSVGTAGATVVGAGLLSIGQTVPGFLAIVIALVLGGVSAFLFRREVPPVSAGAELRAAEARLAVAQQMAAASTERRNRAVARAVRLGLEPDPSALRGLGDEIRRAESAKSARRVWEERTRLLAGALGDASRSLVTELRDRGVNVETATPVDEVMVAAVRYEAECRARLEQALAARDRPGLERALEDRRRADVRFAEDTAQSHKAQALLQEAAVAIGVVDEHAIRQFSEDELVELLNSWEQESQKNREEADNARAEWSRLQVLLDGRTLGELETAARDAEQKAKTLLAGADDDSLRSVSLGDEPDLAVRSYQESVESLEREVAAARRELEVRAERLLSVPEAEEGLAAAQEQLARLESLAEVLEITRSFLAEAQLRVHRDIAPVLVSKVRDRLARVTGDRYVDLTVDPESLTVRVRDARSRWREADLLSHGTAEQIYLLLRVAMAEILTAGDASSPLLLDDSTVQSDPERTRAILDVLHEVSAEHQVILFSQEDDVTAWAEVHLGARDRLLSLPIEPLR